MLIILVLYGYLNNTYPSLKIAKSVKENIYFMWLYSELQSVLDIKQKTLIRLG
ncbi:hypothetical protein [Flavobacterium crassostreae]|uniref:hypothetical protein n=1 Tax=Flavobacterium crassostreae TaxID=1763534 RepID=UPI0012FD3ED8